MIKITLRKSKIQAHVHPITYFTVKEKKRKGAIHSI